MALTMKQTILFTDEDGRARFRERLESLEGGSPAVRLSDLYSSGGFQFRESAVGYESAFHCTEQPQWIVVLKGCMEIVLQDGSTLHGHRSRQCGEEVLQTMFIRA
ncbi:MAG: hypothetical protein EBU15_01540 [Betaproteobacteria bacterium]|nr:hypothetical protein [Betaproteobacteria bacterium]